MGAGGRAGRRVQAGSRGCWTIPTATSRSARTRTSSSRDCCLRCRCGSPELVTTDGEFHTIRRQLDRLAEEGLDDREGRRPAGRYARRTSGGAVDDAHRVRDRLVGAVRDGGDRARPRPRGRARAIGTAWRCSSTRTTISTSCRSTRGTAASSDAFVTGGGYKYCQLGEGNAFLRVPAGLPLRPVLTGWFSEFGALARSCVRRSRAVRRGGRAVQRCDL